jgi:heme o synthase
MSKLRAYYNLTKPGIIMGNTISNIAGFALAAQNDFSIAVFLGAVIGLALVIASACVFNNALDRNIDKKMKRTRKRGLVTGEIGMPAALIYASVLGAMGFGSLIIWTTWIAAYVGLVGFITYVFLYGYTKRRTSLGTIVGSIAGAVPPVVGYTAVTNRIDAAAWILFYILVFWQMPHFYAIAMFRLKEYSAAKVPVLPAVKGLSVTKLYIILYILAFSCTVPLLTIFGYTGITYFVVSVSLGLFWLWSGVKGYRVEPPERWAKRLFGVSLVVLTVLCIMISIERVFP